MTRFHFERPDGIQGNPQNILIHLNEFVPPQGFGGAPPIQFDKMAYEPDNWLNAQWQKRIKKTINVGEMPSPQTNFPIKWEGTFPELIGRSRDEIIFGSSEDIQLEHEIDEFDNVTGKIIAHIVLPLASDGDEIYIYYANPSLPPNQENAPAVWINNFVVVQHMNELSGNILDSSGNGNDGTPTGTPSNTELIGNAKDLAGGSDGFFTPDNDTLDSADITVSATINLNSSTAFQVVASKMINPADNDWNFLFFFGSLAVITVTDNVTSTSVSVGVPHRVGFTITGTTLKIFIDGDVVKTETITAKVASSISSLEIGSSDGSSLRGKLDEFRMSSVGRSDDWMKAEDNTLKIDGNTFFTTGVEESVPTLDRMAYEDLPDIMVYEV